MPSEVAKVASSNANRVIGVNTLIAVGLPPVEIVSYLGMLFTVGNGCWLLSVIVHMSIDQYDVGAIKYCIPRIIRASISCYITVFSSTHQ